MRAMNHPRPEPLPNAENAENLSRNAVMNDLALDLEDVDADERHWESPIDKAARNPQSLRMAVNAMCSQCMGYPDAGWRQAIRFCTAPHCALFRIRPYQTDEP
jgi:hypothetical protein